MKHDYEEFQMYPPAVRAYRARIQFKRVLVVLTSFAALILGLAYHMLTR